MKIQRLLTIAAAGLLVVSGAVLVSCAPAAAAAASASYAGTSTQYFVGHQGGYVGEATVTTDADGNVSSAAIHEWVGPSEWSATLVGGEVIRTPDPLANTTSTDVEIKGYMFYQYSATTKNWLQYSPNATFTTFSATTKIERDFEGTMGNPIRAEAYAKAAAAGTLVAVTITQGAAAAGATPAVLATVTKGALATATVSVGNLDKTNAASTYMPISASSIGYKANAAALLTFFKANPTAAYAAAVTKTAAVTPPSSVYTAATDAVWAVSDVVTGATYSDFPMYATELQNAYIMALAEAKSGNLRSVQ